MGLCCFIGTAAAATTMAVTAATSTATATAAAAAPATATATATATLLLEWAPIARIIATIIATATIIVIIRLVLKSLKGCTQGLAIAVVDHINGSPPALVI